VTTEETQISLAPEHERILLALARGLTRGCGYLAEWNLRPTHPAYRLDGSKPTLHEMRDLGLVEEVPDLDQRWRLTRRGAIVIFGRLTTILAACGEAIEKMEATS